MDIIAIIKDVMGIVGPIVVAYISYRSNKKSKQDIQLEIEKILKEKDAETSQMVHRISAELESQKQLSVWNSSLPHTDEYTNLAGIEIYGNISGIPGLVSSVRGVIDCGLYTYEDLLELRKLLGRVKLPSEEAEIYPYEIQNIVSFKKLIRDLDSLIEKSSL